ncbi:MAG: AsmA-like C-terminal region-containing protein [Verrucomicrobiota bacterium]
MPTAEKESPPARQVLRPRRNWAPVIAFLRRLGVVVAGLILVPVLALYLWLQWYGLPEQVKVTLLDEMERRGVSLDVGSLYLDATGGILADRVTVYRDRERREVWVQIDRARLGIAWISWWQGQPLLESGAVRNATLRLPLSPDTTVDLTRVDADVELDKDILDVRAASARLVNVDLRLEGKIKLDGLPKPKPPSPEEQAARAEAWRQIRGYMQELNTSKPIQLQANFELSTSEPNLATVDVGLVCESFGFRGLYFREAGLSATLEREQVRLEELRILPSRGQLTVYGTGDLARKQGELRFDSTADFAPAGVTLTGKPAELLGRLTFRQLPRISGRAELDWSDGLRYDLQADLDWRSFRLGEEDFERLKLAVGTDGERLIVPQLTLQTAQGGLEAEFFLDRREPEAPVIKARLESDIDPTVFKGIFGDGLDRFLDSVLIPEAGPRLTAEALADGFKTEDWKVTGTIDAGPFFYKKVGFDGARGDFTFADSTLNVPNLVATRADGTVTGGIVFNFGQRWAELTELKSNVDVREVAPVLGGRFPGYVKPYRFQQPPSLVVNGRVDLDASKTGETDTDLEVKVTAPGAMLFEFFGVDFTFVKPRGDLRFESRQMDLKMHRSGLFDGVLTGTMNMDLSTKDPPYEIDFKLSGVDFKDFLTTCFKVESSSGEMDGYAKLSGRLNQLRSMRGRGGLKVRDGYLLSIPFLGGLSLFLSEIIPDWGQARASDADSEFTVAGGKVRTDKMDIYSTNFTLIGEGTYDFVDDDLNLNVRANVRGLPGAFLFPVSKLFEYKGTGKMADPEWEPVNF